MYVRIHALMRWSMCAWILALFIMGRVFCYFFFFKQKTAYEIYQCDWSSDVCSSDLSSGAIFDIRSFLSLNSNSFLALQSNGSLNAFDAAKCSSLLASIRKVLAENSRYL